MQDKKETPEQKRERLSHKELKSNPTGNMNDAFNRANSGNLADLVGSLGWKGTGILILVIIIAFIIVSLFK
ncbi:DUF6366 family protein [Metabacillus sediminilitoris]|uniref:Phage capsid protein n=1 Tax=Metabacillus sediminilitoris TaxID=2567941 RepID=A0A4S4BHZ6_9BACI|nr:DUF6366 family protein [Metabacillus sediminilitoris]QGQ45770.1 hypothetical protein GMB29_11315 [Metabacillus sediminilitoris]THF74183.1 hypothetical protein E6W99_25620 [Metabacillus sediminilitoris]